MASFNLGCIKGDKGDPGPKGERGDKGDKGETGLSGRDGITPVFSVNGVDTLDYSQEASVEIDASDPANPALYFKIPRGKDAIDKEGDMIAGIYDTKGRKTDFYEFAQTLFEKTLLKEGGSLLGKVYAWEAPLSENCVRNISFCATLPENAVIGDVCFAFSDNTAVKLGDCQEGSIIILEEAGEATEYILASKTIHGEGNVTLVRKYLTDKTEYYDFAKRGIYYGSDADMYLETVFAKLFTEGIQKKLVAAQLEESERRHCFLPSVEEYSAMEYFKEHGIVTSLKNGKYKEYYLTRSLTDSKRVFGANTSGYYSSVYQNVKCNLRPAIVLRGDIPVEKVDNNGEAGMRIVGEKTGIYIYADEGWKEFVF